MENSKLHKIKGDLRQSSAWSRYLRSLGWKTLELSNGSKIYLRKFPLIGATAKLQRPAVLSKKVLDEIKLVCKKHKIFYLKIESNFNAPTNILKQYGYSKSNFPLLPPSTILIDLNSNIEILQKKLSKDAEYSIRKADKDKIEVEIIQKPLQNHIDDFYKIIKSSAGRNSIETASIKNLKSLAGHFDKNLHLGFAKNNAGELTAGNLYLSHKNTVWYLYGGLTKAGRKDTSGYKLMWESILYFKNQNFDFLDLGGIDDPRFPKHTKNWKGFSRFKRKFGGKIVKFPHPYIKTRPGILKLIFN